MDDEKWSRNYKPAEKVTLHSPETNSVPPETELKIESQLGPTAQPHSELPPEPCCESSSEPRCEPAPEPYHEPDPSDALYQRPIPSNDISPTGKVIAEKLKTFAPSLADRDGEPKSDGGIKQQPSRIDGHTVRMIVIALVSSVLGSGLVAFGYMSFVKSRIPSSTVVPAIVGWKPTVLNAVDLQLQETESKLEAERHDQTEFWKIQQAERKRLEKERKEWARRGIDKSTEAEKEKQKQEASKAIDRSFKKMLSMKKSNKSALDREMQTIIGYGREPFQQKFTSAQDNKIAMLAAIALSKIEQEQNKSYYYGSSTYELMCEAVRDNKNMEAVSAFFAATGRRGIAYLEGLTGLSEAPEVRDRATVLLASTLRKSLHDSEKLTNRIVSLGALRALAEIYKRARSQSVQEAVVYCLQYGPGPSSEVVALARDAANRKLSGAEEVFDTLNARFHANADINDGD